jgi:hypothetical protein
MDKRFSTTFKIQATAKGQRKTIAGVNYAVYPSVILVEGVHHGAIGAPTMYPTDVLEASAPHWNNIPVTINHPQDQEGVYVSAGSPEVLSAWAVGKLLNSRFEDGKLKAEVMIDLKKAAAKHSTLINSLDRSVEMELSTGLFGEEVMEPGLWNNEAYETRLTAIQPDHLALLPDATGACSWADGCGVRANMKVNAGPAVNQSKEDYHPDKANVLSHDATHQQLWSYVNFHDQKRDIANGPFRYNYIVEVYDNYFIYEEESQDGVKHWRQSYSINADDKVVVTDDKTQVQKRVEYVPINPNANEENKMAKEKKCCADRVAALIANEATPYTAEDSEMLTALTEAQMEKLEAPYKANADADPKKDDPTDKGVVVNVGAEETPEQKWEAFMTSAPAEFRAVINAGTRALDAKRTEAITKIKANALNTLTDDELKAMPDVVLEKLALVAAPEVKRPNYSGQGGGFQTNASDDGEEPYVPVTINFAKPEVK